MKRGRQGEGGGRKPVVFNKAQIAQVEALAAVLNQTQLSDYFGISHTTFIEICKRQEDVSLAYKRGRAKSILNVGTNLIKQAEEGNTAASIFYLKTQAGWKEDKHDSETSEQPSLSINFSVSDPKADIKVTNASS